MRRMAWMFVVVVVCFILRPSGVPIRSTVAAADPQFMWCWSASIKPDLHQYYYSSVFQADPADRLKIEGAYWKSLEGTYPNPGPARCPFSAKRDWADTEKKKAKAEAKFENWEAIETGWTYSN
jgi:hypothetical protein